MCKLTLCCNVYNTHVCSAFRVYLTKQCVFYMRLSYKEY